VREVAIVYLVRKAVVTQACVPEDRSASASLERSSEFVRGEEKRPPACDAATRSFTELSRKSDGSIVGLGARS
jgi:hypothetical protein